MTKSPAKRSGGDTAIVIMLAIDIAIATLLFYDKLTAHTPSVEYIHLLVTYHFGFIKRAFIGALLSLFVDKVPVYFVYTIGLSIWLLTLGLYVVLFSRSFGRPKQHPLLFAFIAGSPFFFKNFLFAIGYFDIYGCAFAILALLIPVNAAYLPLLAGGCVVLLLIHLLHLFIYLPTIGFIFVVRYYLLSPANPRKIIAGALAALLISAVFLITLSANAPVPRDTLFAYIQSRALDPVQREFLFVWYSNVGAEVRETWRLFPDHALRFPVYALLLAVHAPMIRLFGQIVSSLADRRQKALVLTSLAGITLAYLIMWIIVHDHARHISNWAVCMLLAMHATMMLPSNKPAVAATFDTPANRVFAWIVTLIPRVGIVVPF
jgi:hypothetical protein